MPKALIRTNSFNFDHRIGVYLMVKINFYFHIQHILVSDRSPEMTNASYCINSFSLKYKKHVVKEDNFVSLCYSA